MGKPKKEQESLDLIFKRLTVAYNLGMCHTSYFKTLDAIGLFAMAR